MKIRDRIVELRRVPARDLIPNPKNWRTHPKAQQEAMQGILAEIGYADALLARETPNGLQIIDGHMRAETTPDQEVPVLVLDGDKMFLAALKKDGLKVGLRTISMDELSTHLAEAKRVYHLWQKRKGKSGYDRFTSGVEMCGLTLDIRALARAGVRLQMAQRLMRHSHAGPDRQCLHPARAARSARGCGAAEWDQRRADAPACLGGGTCSSDRGGGP